MKIRLFTIPNAITLCNLLCGVGAIIATVGFNDLPLAFILVMSAAVFDFFDGFTARLLNQYSAIGVQLDSLADMVSFGTAPAFVMYKLVQNSQCICSCTCPCMELLPYVPFLMTAFSALRLAKFNIDETQHEEFCGLTTTANGIFCTSLAAALTWSDAVVAREWMVLITIIMACLLISPIRMFSFKFKSYVWSENRLRYIFLACAVMLIALLGVYSIPTIIVLYIVVSTVRWIVK